MTANDLILLVIVAAGAFYAGLQVGRYKALAELGAGRRAPESGPLPGPLDTPYAEPPAAPSQPRGAPPPASAGGGRADTGGAFGRPAPPRRSSRPPPAAAGLMGTGTAEKSGERQK